MVRDTDGNGFEGGAVFGVSIEGGYGMSEYKGLAAAVIKSAVDDLQSAYKKVGQWGELDRKGALKEYVKRATERRAASAISLSSSELSAVDFFKESSEIRQLYFGMLDMEDVPAAIQKQRDFVKENRKSLEDKIQYFRRLIVKENEERTNSGHFIY